ncbi:MAG: indole-3-glycerol-phosphate synthase [Thaumarchaeota archaeon]|nr:indole-3-glycerol-phosphate synthase [Nitrososphaerota archaeon]
MQRTDESFLGELLRVAQARVGRGYYSVKGGTKARRRSLVSALRNAERIPIVAEVKFRSPAEGKLAPARDAGRVARAFEKGGAIGVSVLTEPEHFDGRLEYLKEVKRAVGLPVLMKDIIVDEMQIRAAGDLGADALLLIASAFGGEEGRRRLDELMARSHDEGLEVLLEVHDENEYASALSGEADIVGINNRDLRTLGISLGTSRRLLRLGPHSKPVICESGIRTRTEIASLRRLGADGFLLGSALMRAEDPEETLRALSEL